jgi:nicotinamidase-related amidase
MLLAKEHSRLRKAAMQLDPRSTALVLIDLQKGVLAMPVAPHPAAQVYERSLRLAERFRAVKAPVVWVRVAFSADLADAPRTPVDRPTDYGALPAGWDELPQPPAAADLLITKRQWGAFYGTDLDLQLRRRARRCIVLGGIATNIGVESTARSAAEHGYELIIPEDLCSCRSAESHAFSFQQVFPRLARVTTSDAITFG